jgi:hypothetical protein
VRDQALGIGLRTAPVAARHHNMNELRPPSTGTSEVRLLFAFDRTEKLSSQQPATSQAAGRSGTAKRSRWPTNDSTSICRR